MSLGGATVWAWGLKDLHVGMSWLKEAAKQGHSDAKQLLDMILKDADE